MRRPAAPVTVDEALAAVRAASWAGRVATCGHRGCADHQGDGPRFIHVRSSGFGMDVSLESVEAELRTASWIGWVAGPLGHDLAAVTANGHTHCYDVRRPAVPDV